MTDSPHITPIRYRIQVHLNLYVKKMERVMCDVCVAPSAKTAGTLESALPVHLPCSVTLSETTTSRGEKGGWGEERKGGKEGRRERETER